ncbi:acetolactate synthase 2, chloroplastic [Tanacetum coccineum]
MSRLPKPPNALHFQQIVRFITESKKPLLYVGGGCMNSSAELRRFVELTGIPVANTLMGLGTYPGSDDLSLHTLGMHGTIYANYAVDKSDLLLAFGVRFDDRVTGKLDTFASRAKIVHIDIDEWRKEVGEQKANNPLTFKTFGDSIPPQYAIQVLDELTSGNAIIRLGAMGFGLPAAIGTSVARPAATVVDIDGDGSFMMNVQGLATIRVENLRVKIMKLNNQHLGMVVQWADQFYKANRAHTYSGDPSKEAEIFPNMLGFADACGIPGARVTNKEDFRAAIQTMLDTPGPYLLDVIVPHQEHVLPMIPARGGFQGCDY